MKMKEEKKKKKKWEVNQNIYSPSVTTMEI